MFNLIKKEIVIFVVIISFCLPFFSSAFAIKDEHITIKTKPSYPNANQFVTVSVGSHITDLGDAEILWFLNGLLQKKGVGETSFTFETGDLGETSNIIAQITSPHFSPIEKTINIRPAEVDLFWEADSYTPPFYKGKALRSYGSGLKVVAVPSFIDDNGGLIDHKKLSYRWELEGFVLGSRSGKGKNTIYLSGEEVLMQDLLVLEVYSIDNRIKAKRGITLADYDPKIIFYEEDPLLGTNYDHAITGDFNLSRDEIVVRAIPYFFSTFDVLGGGLEYNWSLNNERLNDFKDSVITLRQGGDEGGVASLYLQIENIYKILQSTSDGFNINFTRSQKKLFE